MEFDNTFWALVALLIFIGGVFYLKVPSTVAKSLDERGEKIAKDLEEARKLREEAQALLASYQRKQREAQTEADEIIEAAKNEAAHMVEEIRGELAEQLDRRTKTAEDKIMAAEAQAMAEVQSIAADAAVSSARMVIAAKTDAAADAKIIDAEIATLGAKLG